MSKLPQSELTHIEATLRERRKDLVGALYQRLHRPDAPEEMAMVNYFETIDEQAGAATMTDNELAQLKHEMAELRRVDLALARVIAGDYGQCASCGNPIGHARLEAVPDASLCVTCQTRVEHDPGAERHQD